VKKLLKKCVLAGVGLLVLVIGLGLSLLLLVTHPVLYLMLTIGGALLYGLTVLTQWALSPD
jgi:hypothetical protein